MLALLKKLSLIAVVLLQNAAIYAQEEVNYDESKIPPYVLPELLTSLNGTKITSVSEWEKIRRPELFSLYESQVFGKSPAHPEYLHFKLLTEDTHALDGLATRKEIAMYFTKENTRYVTILMYLPNKREKPVPVFLGLNFKGNHSVSTDPGITITETCLQQGNKMHPRGSEAPRWPIKILLENGYGVVTVQNSDIEPDRDTGFQEGLHPLFYTPGQTAPRPDEWGTLAAWSFGLSCIMDYLVTDSAVDSRKVAVIGHSRNGKAALWAGAMDKRFAIVVSNDSGCGGAALFRRRIGETVRIVNTMFPHWFCGNFKQYNDKEDEIPVDQHALIALIAPRPVYVASAAGDRWADPKGEFLSTAHASPVYALYGLQGMSIQEMPELDTPVTDGYIGYHIRPGEHNIKLYDWQQYVRFANKFFKKSATK